MSIWCGGSFDVDVKDAFVDRFRRFGPKAIAVDEDSRCRQTDRGNRLAIDLQVNESPCAFQRAEKLFDVSRPVEATPRKPLLPPRPSARPPVGIPPIGFGQADIISAAGRCA